LDGAAHGPIVEAALLDPLLAAFTPVLILHNDYSFAPFL
jgi:hypothetical protein